MILEPLQGKLCVDGYEGESFFMKDAVKSAVEFYKRYRDDIDKLFKNEREIYNEWFKYIEPKLETDTSIRQIKVMYAYYNDWLLDYCFEDVIE